MRGPDRSAGGSVNREDLWRVHASCRDHHTPSLWFPARGPAIAARAICAACPVRGDCLQVALLDVEEHGIWGGLSERVRRVLRRLLLASPHPDRALVQYRCRCDFCKALRDQDRRMKAITRGEKVERLNTNGPGAVCGNPGTYAKGCHCDACTDAMRASRHRNQPEREFRPPLGQRLEEEADRRGQGAVA